MSGNQSHSLVNWSSHAYFLLHLVTGRFCLNWNFNWVTTHSINYTSPARPKQRESCCICTQPLKGTGFQSWLEVSALTSPSPQLVLPFVLLQLCTVRDLACQTEELVIGDPIKAEEWTGKAAAQIWVLKVTLVYTAV